MTEKDHELRLIQNSGDPKHWRDFKDFALRVSNALHTMRLLYL